MNRLMITSEDMGNKVKIGDKFNVVRYGATHTAKRGGGRTKARVTRWKVIAKYKFHALCDCGVYKACFSYLDILKGKSGHELTEEF